MRKTERASQQKVAGTGPTAHDACIDAAAMGALRCHLLIGPPASGKTTLAATLAPLLQAELLSTDAIREQLYGDASIQGHWPEVQDQLHRDIAEHVASGRSVLIDATHARRPWRLAITQRLRLPVPVEWIGWWLRTPRDVCVEWNRQRPRQVPELVIHQFAAALDDPVFGPDRSEGLSALVDFDPSLAGDLVTRLNGEIERIDRRVVAARNKERSKQLHGYSRLLDLERLLYLVQLLSRYPGLSGADPATRAELEAICNPLPQGAMPERAAALIGALRGECYGDVDAIEADLLWLERQGFFCISTSQSAITPPPPKGVLPENATGGWPAMADQSVFIRVFSLLRHLLQKPFDHERGTPLTEQLIRSLDGIYMPGESATLRKDIERILTPYGFRTRNDNVRHGYGIGSAVLSAPRLREVHQVISQAAGRLGDPTAQDLLAELDERLRWGGVLPDDEPPVRAFANRSIVHPELVRQGSLAVPEQAERLEAAIRAGQRILLERFSDAAQFGIDPVPAVRVWPLQLVFHNIGWYLAYELDAVGRDHGLIRTERLDRLALRQVDAGFRRTSQERQRRVQRLSALMEMSGGIYFGEDPDAQQRLIGTEGEARRAELVTVRFRCTLHVYRFLREGLQRYPMEQLRLSRPLPDDQWRRPGKAPLVLDPLPGETHPFPVEIDLPSWTIERDVDFRRWLLGYGADVIIEAPGQLREEHQSRAQQVAGQY